MTTTTDRDLRGINFEEGYIAVIDKPLEWTSTDVVRKIGRASCRERVSHQV